MATERRGGGREEGTREEEEGEEEEEEEGEEKESEDELIQRLILHCPLYPLDEEILDARSYELQPPQVIV
jgi:hypothetical protein